MKNLFSEISGAIPFNEKAIQNELLIPLFADLGYTTTGLHRYGKGVAVDQNTLKVGSFQYKINTAPELALFIGDSLAAVIFVVDPNEKTSRDKMAGQAFAYSLISRNRGGLFILCNGRELMIYSIRLRSPIFGLNVQDIQRQLPSLQRILCPRNLFKSEYQNFKPDFGLAMHYIGMKPRAMMQIVDCSLSSIIQVDDDLYVCSAVTCTSELQFLVTIDLSKVQFKSLISQFSSKLSITLPNKSKGGCDFTMLNVKIQITCQGYLSEVISGPLEQFASVVATKILDVKYESAAELR